MAENALRNLQIFRNGAVITGKTASEIRTMVDSALVAGTLILHDGEPISIRYVEDGNVKGLMGVAYIKGNTKQVLWTGNDIKIETSPKSNSLITLTHTEDPEGHYTLTVAYKTVKLEDATDTNDGLATAKDVKDYIDNLPHKTYKVAKKETAEDGYIATYYLEDENGVQSGASINIPKDFLVKSGKVKTVETADQPYEGAVVGDKYIDFVINVKEGTATDEHIYLPVNDLVDAYTAGNGLELSSTNEFSVKYTNEGHNVTFAFDENGALVADYTETVYNGADGISLTENATTGKVDIAVELSEADGNILNFKEGKLFAQLGASTAISDIQVIDNTTENDKYYTVDTTGKIVEDTTEEHTGAFVVPAGKKMLLVATEDKKINGAILPETEDTFVESGELVEIAATETEAAKTVIRLSYNTSKEPIDINVTDLVNTSHTTVEGEDTELNNSDYVNVKATTDEETNTVTLSSTIKTVALEDATAASEGELVGPHDAEYNTQTVIAKGMYMATTLGPYTNEEWEAFRTAGKIVSQTTKNGDVYNNCLLVDDSNWDRINTYFTGGKVVDYFLYKTDAVEENDGLTTAVNVKNYINTEISKISHTTVTSEDATVTVTETTVNGHKNYDLSVEIPEVDAAVVERNLGSDSLNVTTEGVLNQNAMTVIENYIDNYDCGTFEFVANEMAGALNNTLNNAGTGEENQTNVDDNINVNGDAGTITIQ